MAASDDLIEAWQTAGLYISDSDNAAQRLELLSWLHERGVTHQQMVTAHEKGNLGSLAGDSHLRGNAQWSLRRVAQQLDTTTDMIEQLRRAGGFPPIDLDEPSFTDGDLVLFRSFIEASAFFSHEELLHVTRVIGASLRRIADATSEMFFFDVEAPLRTGEGNELALAQKNLEGMLLTRAAIAVFEPMFLAQLQESLLSSRTARRNSSDLGTMPLAVGFVDLSGFTSLAEQISPDDLLRAVLEFESTAYDLVADCGGRVVKLIGDEVMFTTVDAESACDIALGLVGTIGPHETARPRGGVVFGNVIAHGGDIYGVTVNRASRMADIAVPDEVLVDAAVVSSAPMHLFEPAGRRQLKGFRNPIPLWSLRPGRSGG